jgi:ubiquinol-cytochrome c reductase cytochrome c1 subunit
MKKLIALIAFALLPVAGMASSEGVHLDPANIDVGDEASIQKGAKHFVNYCMGCHSAKYVRYKQLTKVGLSVDQVKDNLMFTGGKIGDKMTIAMKPADAAKWFGAPPPDLTLVARIRGADWIYTYLRSFYRDDSRPFGVNNVVFPSVGMPHVLVGLQGVQEPVYEEVEHGGKTHKVLEGLELVEAGSLTPAEYDAMARELTTFLTYIAEPVKQERQHLGVWVTLFLLVLFVLAYMMKKEWWKDIH